METDEHVPAAGRPLRRAVPIIAIGLAAIAGLIFLREFLSFETLRDNRAALEAFRDANYLGTSLAFIAIYIVIVAFSLPGAAIASLAGGFLFGVFPGTLFNVGAATVGATAIFLAARAGFGEALSRRMDAREGAVKRIHQGLLENELSFLFFMRLVPAVPFFVANLVPALVGVSLRNFVVTTFFGIMPGGLVYTWVGAGLGEVFDRGESPDLGIIFEPAILLPILALAALSLMPVAIKVLRRKA